MALFRSTAATVESTPPERPRITLSLPMVSLRDPMELSMKEAGVQSPLHPQIRMAKFSFYMICGVCHVVCRSDDFRTFWQTCNGVAVGHPYLRVIWNPFKQGA